MKHFLPSKFVFYYDVVREYAEKATDLLQKGDLTSLFAHGENDEFLQGFKAYLTLDWSCSPEVRGYVFPKEVRDTLAEVLKDVIDFDKVFREKLFSVVSYAWYDSIERPNVDNVEIGSRQFLDFVSWQDGFQNLDKKTQDKIREAFRKCKNLSDRIFDAVLKAGKDVDARALAFMEKNNLDPSYSYYDSGTKYQYQRLKKELYPEELDFSAVGALKHQVKYLRPLRESPKPLYPLVSGLDPDDVGLSGENTAAVFDTYKDKPIEYYFAPEDEFSELHERTFKQAVDVWLRRLGVADEVETQEYGKKGHELTVKFSDKDSSYDLTNVGVGVSQVLPILVMGLLADRGDILIFEQPELHLHPRVQTRLGDFFISLAQRGVQCIIETHSEYLIDQMRYRIVASPADKNGRTIKDLVKLYFAEKPEQYTTFREIEINDFGALSEWPEGFFDESHKTARQLLLAAAEKWKTRRVEKEAKDD